MIFYLFLFLVQKALFSCPQFMFQNNTCSPCSIRCSICISSTSCLTCSPQHYMASNGQCKNCPSNCMTCTSQGICTACNQPYQLINSACQACSVPNAATCLSTSIVETCISRYFSSSSFCGSCPLHCLSCMNSTYCVSCSSGYFLQYQNSVCTACNNCAICSGTASNCIACFNGYKLSGNTCISTTCSIANCAYCSENNICGNCNRNYYLLNNNCEYGSSILCQAGALGSWPNQCKQCGNNTYIGSTYNNQLYCVPYSSKQSGTVNQFYYYIFNDYPLIFPGATLTSNCGDQTYIINPGDIILNIGNYYSLTLVIKGYSLSLSSILTVNLTDNIKYENTNITLTGNCKPIIFSIKPVTLNTNPLTIQFINSSDFGLIELLIVSKLCSVGCVKCLNKELCIQCENPKYLLNYGCVQSCGNYYQLNQSNILSCVISCPDGFYAFGNKCQACVSPCLTCLNSTLCFSCAIVNTVQYYYMSLNNTCVSQCPEKYFHQGTICSPCISPCGLCTSQTTCLSCIQGYWNGTGCSALCPSGTYADAFLNSCQMCQNCLTCINSSTICTSCNAGLILFDNSCISSCTSGYYQSGLTCLRCVSPCLSCSSSTNCLSCSIGYLQGTSCISSCSIGKYGDLTTQTCKICNSSCSSCISQTQCTTCAPNYCLQLSICTLSSLGCLDSYYSTTVSSSCVCTPCSYPCKLCLSQTQCISCISGYLSQTTCIPNCPTLHYGNTTSQTCLLCSSLFPNCLQCSEFLCSSCTPGYLFNQFSIDNNYCVQFCPNLYYNNSNSCVHCLAPCSKCISSTICTSCIDGYTFNNGNCVLQCNIGDYLLVQSTGNICLPCIYPCKTCINSTACLSCVRTSVVNAQTYLFNSSCSSCLDGYYSSLITLECQKCLFPCLTCLSQSSCLSCTTGFYNSSSNTCSQCSQGTYADNNTMLCVKCKNNCLSCTSASTCSRCTNNTYLKSNECISQSQCQSYSGFYVNILALVCSNCVTPCLTCTNSTNCLSCLPGYMYFNNACIVVCPKKYYNNISFQLCTQCPIQCETCTSSTSCLSCSSSYLYYKNNLSCLSVCPPRTYKISSQCLDCKYPCLQCLSQSSCISCQNGILLESNKSCITSCPSSFFSFNGNCQPCDTSCFQCSIISTNCTSCSIGSYLYNNECISTCTNGYFGDNQALTCFQCVTPCQYCSDRVSCTKCSDDYSFIVALNQCTLVCPQSYFSINNTDTTQSASKKLCVSCKPQCMTCSSPTSCDLCINGYQFEGNCISSCPSQMYAQHGVCNNCSLPCFNCSSTTVCLSCPLNSGYLLVASSQCYLTDTCPYGYFLQPSLKQCQINCPSGYFKQPISRTCLTSCPSHYFKGTDSTCYQSCPKMSFGNSTYFCESCNQQCPHPLLFFTFTTQIIVDDLYLIIDFTIAPIFKEKISVDKILISPYIDCQITKTTQDSITLHLYPHTSIKSSLMTLRFLTPFDIFNQTMPLQNPKQSILFSGYNFYNYNLPNLLDFATTIGVITALIGIWKGYLGLDFIQNLFIYNLIALHYPPHLSSFLQGFKYSHFYFKIVDLAAPALDKFKSSVDNMSLFGNATHSVLFIVFFLIVALILLLIQKIRGHKVQPSSGQYTIEGTNSHLTFWKRIDFVYTFKTYLPMMVFYAFSTYIILFSICQLYNWNLQNSSYSLASRYLSSIVLVLIISYPILLIFLIQPRPILFSLLILRKLIVCICLIVAMKYPIFILGFMAVTSLSTVVLLITHNPYKWKVQFIINSIGQGIQLLLSILFSIFTFYSEGIETQNKVNIAHAIIVIACLGILVYSVLNIIFIVCWFIKMVTGKDYIDIWSTLLSNEVNVSEPQSQNQTGSVLKLRRSSNKLGSNIIQQDVIVEVQKHQQQSQRQNPQKDDENYNPEFRVYSDNQQKTEDNHKAPEFLVKVVNDFQDYQS